jgi:hypothetical protein
MAPVVASLAESLEDQVVILRRDPRPMVDHVEDDGALGRRGPADRHRRVGR